MSTGGRKVVNIGQNFVNVVKERTFKAGPETDDHIGFVGRSRGSVPIYWPFYWASATRIKFVKQWIAKSQDNCLHLQKCPMDLDGMWYVDILPKDRDLISKMNLFIHFLNFENVVETLGDSLIPGTFVEITLFRFYFLGNVDR